MKTALTTLTLVSLTTFTAFATSEENIHETKAAKPGGKLVVEVDFGSINVAAGASDKVVIDAHREIDASSKEKEEQYLKAVPITITTEGDTVAVRAVRKRESLGAQIWSALRHTRNDARYTIRVPASFNADLQTAGGEISATGLSGTIKVETSGGDLSFDRLHGTVDADTAGGDVTAKACDGKIHLESSGGRIEATSGRGTLRADTAGGAITVKDFAGDTNVESSGGRLRLANISGKVKAQTAGGAISAILSSPVVGDVNLETSAGAITVLAPPGAGLTIDAETSAGSVESDLPVARMHADHDSLKGTINGGGKSVVLRSGAGSIQIVSADKETAQQ